MSLSDCIYGLVSKTLTSMYDHNRNPPANVILTNSNLIQSGNTNPDKQNESRQATYCLKSRRVVVISTSWREFLSLNTIVASRLSLPEFSFRKTTEIY